MARAGYCSHGWHIPTQKAREPMKVTLPDGTEKIIPPIIVECPLCVSERKARKDALEYQQAAEIHMVKQNFLRLLKEDQEFADEVRRLLGEPVSKSSFENQKRCC